MKEELVLIDITQLSEDSILVRQAKTSLDHLYIRIDNEGKAEERAVLIGKEEIKQLYDYLGRWLANFEDKKNNERDEIIFKIHELLDEKFNIASEIANLKIKLRELSKEGAIK